jgi:8-oxo-dGTP pyrophosphatase MutT (NUDIX family)
MEKRLNKKRVPAVRAGIKLVDKTGTRVLLVPQISNRWGIPKGGQKPGETLWETATRELQEEAGLDVRGLVYKLEKIQWFDHVYATDLGACIFTLRLLSNWTPVCGSVDDKDVCGEPTWTPIKTLKTLKLNYTTKKALNLMS